jgi:uncharacterized phage protein (TIGR01671 family)
MKQRVIKFRVWDKLDNKYLNRGDDESVNEYAIRTDGTIVMIEHESGSCDVIRDRRQEYYFVEQFTGLTDKNGKEIYEGDIVRRDKHELTPGNILDYEVVFLRGSFLVFRPYGEHHTTDLGSMTGILSVIGNIHENPELLNQ